MIPKGYQSMDTAPKNRTIVVAFSDGVKRKVFWLDNAWIRDEQQTIYPVENEPLIADCWHDERTRNDHDVYDALHWREVSALDWMGNGTQ